MSGAPAAGAHRLEACLAAVGDDPIVVVDSPPGAGKTSLVVQVAAFRVLERRQRVLVATVTNLAADDVSRRLSREYPRAPTFRVLGGAASAPTGVTGMRTLPLAHSAPHVAVVTLAKLALEVDRTTVRERYAACLVDEAYLVPASDLYAALQIARQQVLVGDPGQLPPVVRVDTSEWQDLPLRPDEAAPRALAARAEGVVRRQLRETYRLRPDTAALVQAAFYPDNPFRAAGPARQLDYRAEPGDGLDELIARATLGDVSLVAGELPAADRPMVDGDAARVAAELVGRLVERAAWREVGASTRIGPDHVAVVAAHVAQVVALREALRRRLGEVAGTVLCDTVERLQGQQRPVVVVLHPLSGMGEIRSFELAAGRLCVMLSRAQVATFVLFRAGVTESLRRFRTFDPRDYAGRRAHQLVMDWLVANGRVGRV
ncbi:MAG: ATP-binding protein [Chloroflexi bacterium]|nr:ATP-binding protein [Chloroflexota bacterium]